MAIQNLQARIDKLYELTFGQIEQKKGMKKPKSQATRRLRRTLGGNPIIWLENAGVTLTIFFFVRG